MSDRSARTRTFAAPAGTVVDGFTLPETVRVTLDYSPSEMTGSQAQKAAMRQVRDRIRDTYGVTPTLAGLQRATATVQRSRGRVRGGRVPDVRKVDGFRTDKGRKVAGLHTYTLGSERGRVIGGAFARMERMVVAAFERHPRGRVAVAVYGYPPDGDNPSPRRRRKDHPLGIWKRGDVIPRARQWGQSAQLSSPASFERVYGTPEQWAENVHVDPDRTYRIDVIVREG